MNWWMMAGPFLAGAICGAMLTVVLSIFSSDAEDGSDRHARIVALFERMVAADWVADGGPDDGALSTTWRAAETVIDFEDEMRKEGGAK